jgi:tRNA 2-thiocytidine biosynthesis protein TtcA
MNTGNKDIKARRQFNKICKKVGKTIYDFNLIENNDRVLVGLSGGKDSLILVETLADRKKHIPVSFELFAIHVTAVNVGYKADTEYLADFCKELDVPLYLEEVEVDFNRKPEKQPCFICSWARRKKIFNKAKEIECNKIALGHHFDDAVKTMLMNMIYHGSYSSLPQKLSMFGGRTELIRPLLMIPEKELALYASLRGFGQHEKSCPYQDSTKRHEMEDLILYIERLNADARKNLFRAMDNIYREYLPWKKG